MTEPYWQDENVEIYNGDCLEVMKELEDESVDTIITDPPYGLGFMGKEWDSFGEIPSGFKGKSPANEESDNPYFSQKGQTISSSSENNLVLQKFNYMWAKEALRVAKPGAMMLCFGGTRTFHRIVCGIEDAGWEIRDTLMWLYGTGFPKSHNIGKSVMKKVGDEGEKVGEEEVDTGIQSGSMHAGRDSKVEKRDVKEPTSEEGKKWKNYGTALKPAYEPIIMAMKSKDRTYAENALEHNVAGLNIDGGRISLGEEDNPKGSAKRVYRNNEYTNEKIYGDNKVTPDEGRFPTNIIHNGSKEVIENMGDKSRYFYCAKASKSERNMGLGEFEEKEKPYHQDYRKNKEAKGDDTPYAGAGRTGNKIKNDHPTVKSLALMEYLVRLTKMPNENQIYLDPFLGSGTTAMAVKKYERSCIGIEKEEDYCRIACERVKSIQRGLF